MNTFTLLLLVTLVLVRSGRVSGADYDVYLFAGQSNMDGRGSADDLNESQRQPFEDVVIYYRRPPHTTDGWKALGPGYSIPPRYNGGLPSTTFGPELGFALAMTKALPERQFAFIKGSQGGTSLRADWNPGHTGQPETQGPCYRNFLETIRLATNDLTQAGHSLRLCGLLWHQGESDSKSAADVYQQQLLQFVARIREDTGVADLPVVVGEVFDNGERDAIRAALHTVGNSGPRLGFVSSEGTTTWDNGTHFDAASQLLLGQRYAQAMLTINSVTP